MALAKDLSTSVDRARVVDTQPPGKVIYRSDFDAGFDGWIDHWGGFRPQPVVSLTTEMQLRGSRCLMLSTGEGATPNAGDPSNAPAVFKRLYRHDEYRYHHLSAWVALGIGNFSGSWQSFQLLIDTQKMDNSARSFFKLQCDNTQAAPAFLRWQVRGNGGDADFHTVTGTSGLMIGDNENKQGFEYVRLTVDLAANGGLGGYQQMQIGGQVFDLTGSGGGSSTETPQWDGSAQITGFRGGFNIGFTVGRNQAITGGCQLFVDDVVYSVSNTMGA